MDADRFPVYQRFMRVPISHVATEYGFRERLLFLDLFPVRERQSVQLAADCLGLGKPSGKSERFRLIEHPQFFVE